jgi:hypothetical protein
MALRKHLILSATLSLGEGEQSKDATFAIQVSNKNSHAVAPE